MSRVAVEIRAYLEAQAALRWRSGFADRTALGVAQFGGKHPDFFMFGDPHNNYYRGSVYYDDIKLEAWQGY